MVAASAGAGAAVPEEHEDVGCRVAVSRHVPALLGDAGFSRERCCQPSGRVDAHFDMASGRCSAGSPWRSTSGPSPALARPSADRARSPSLYDALRTSGRHDGWPLAPETVLNVDQILPKALGDAEGLGLVNRKASSAEDRAVRTLSSQGRQDPSGFD